MSQAFFQYRAINPLGAKVSGVLRAGDQREAYRQILAQGLRPVRIAGTRHPMAKRGSRGISKRDLAHLTLQLSVFMEARIPIADGLRSIADQERHSHLRWVIEDVAKQVESGCTITDALAPHRELFGDVFIETIRAAQASGNMAEVLAHLAEMLDQHDEASRRVKAALMYPLCVVVTIVLAIIFLMIVVVPRFSSMFEARGLELPAPTQVVIALSGWLRTWWYLALGACVASVVGGRQVWRHEPARRAIDTTLHRLPALRDLLRFSAVARFSHILGLTLRSGVSLIDALEMARKASGRPLLQAEIQKVQREVNRGAALSDVIATCRYLPGFARRMIVAGVEAAELPRMCSIVARQYERELQYATRNLATVIEPILIVGLAAIVLLMALAFFLPMWNMGALVG